VGTGEKEKGIASHCKVVRGSFIKGKVFEDYFWLIYKMASSMPLLNQYFFSVNFPSAIVEVNRLKLKQFSITADQTLCHVLHAL